MALWGHSTVGYYIESLGVSKAQFPIGQQSTGQQVSMLVFSRHIFEKFKNNGSITVVFQCNGQKSNCNGSVTC